MLALEIQIKIQIIQGHGKEDGWMRGRKGPWEGKSQSWHPGAEERNYVGRNRAVKARAYVG